MEAGCGLKRERVEELDMCIICQDDTGDKLVKPTEKGFLSVVDAAQSRQKNQDRNNKLAIDRILSKSDASHSLVWHKTCFSSFTSKHHISRLFEASKDETSCSNTDTNQSPNISVSRTSRSSIGSIMNWEACMFCQNVHTKGKLSSVTTFKMSGQILEASRFDQTLSVRLAGVNDLIASEGKYHVGCFVKFSRHTSYTKEHSVNNDIAMQWLVLELKDAAQKAHVLEISEVWKRYCALAETADVEIPASFKSRRTSFKEKLVSQIKEEYDIITIPGKQTLLIPLKFERSAIYDLVTEDTEEPSPLQVYDHGDDAFLEMVHVALKLRSDILAHPLYEGFVINEDKMISSVPTNLFMFLRLMFGGQRLLEADPEDEQTDMQEKESKIQTKILSIGQDLVYNISGGKHWTPKHIALASTLHQATRSKELVQLFHNAGHTVSYDNVKQVDTALAEKTLATMDPETGAVTPPNFTPGRFVHFTCDNIDINDASFDGKNSFHATQLAGWQRGPESDMGMQDLRPSTRTALQVPEIMEAILPVAILEGKTEPKSTNETKREWFSETLETPSLNLSFEKDMAFFISRQGDDNESKRVGWTHFNQTLTNESQEITSVGYMPIIQAPAHEFDTLNTVVRRCKHVASALGQQHVVLTVDEALFGKLMELKWAKPEYEEWLFVRLGGLHTALNFLKAIGQHMQSSGLLDVWTESHTLGPRAAEQVLAGKNYARGMRTHKLTLQALWRILMPQLLDTLAETDTALRTEIVSVKDKPDILLPLLASPKFQAIFEQHVTSKSNPNFKFWWEYMQMVEILLHFTRAQREGNWKLHLEAFRCMLPYFMRYNHTNYARWGTIYLNEMHQLPPQVEEEFLQGNFVVKRARQNFNQVDPDQSQEWLNGTGKKGGGIIGITKTPTALSRWALSYNLRSHLSNETKEVFDLGTDDVYVHNETTKGRQNQDNSDEERLFNTFMSLKVLAQDEADCLQNIVTKDLVTPEIERDLLSAKQKGQEQLMHFIEERVIPKEERVTKFRDPLSKNKPLTFNSLFEVTRSRTGSVKEKAIKADRKILQRLITAYEAGRDVNLDEILCHELLPVPLALAEMNGNLRSGSKAIFSQVLTADVPCPPMLEQGELGGQATLIIDGQAMVIALGRPHGAVTFGDFADHFVTGVLQSGAPYKRIDILFDRYYDISIKAGTRKKRGCGARPIRRPIENRNVPLPIRWDNFLAHPDNKADLARFLSQQLILCAPNNKIIVVGGGFSEEERVEASVPDVETDMLEAKHEEADTRVIIHCIECKSSHAVVAARDTDILVLLIAHFHRMPCTRLWLKAGTSKKRKYIPVHTIVEQLHFGENVLEILPAFHALTGCDTTSYIGGHSKKSCWKVFLENHNLLKDLGNGEFTNEVKKNAEKFICRVYGVSNVDTVNKARSQMFVKSCAPDGLPPTSDALSFHVMRCHYQALVWRQADKRRPVLPSPEVMGWSLEANALVPILMSLPAVPESCMELISCKCSTRCRFAHCKCRKARLGCTAACKCRDNDNKCHNNL